MVGYALAKLSFRGRDLIFYIIIFTMTLPFQITLIPQYILMVKFNWTDTYLALIVPYFMNAMGIILFRQHFKTIPVDLIDAARIDGCSEFRIYYQIVLPLAKPALATVAILTFLFTWNDFLGPLIYLSDQLKGTLALGLAMFTGQHQTEWGLLMAASVLMMTPVIIIFFFFQKYFIQAFTTSGIKG